MLELLVILLSNNDTGMCLGENGYYANAKAFYNHFLTNNQKIAFATNNTYAQQRERFIAWGSANGETISFNSSTGDLISNSLNVSIFNKGMSNNYIMLIVFTICGGSLLSLLVFSLKKKKKK